jgi:xanthine/uracil permease
LVGFVKSSKMERDIRQAEDVLAFPDEAKSRRVTHLLETDLLSAGLATQLFFADRTAAGAPPALSQSINEVTHAVRQAHHSGEAVVAAEQARHLGILVAKALNNCER